MKEIRFSTGAELRMGDESEKPKIKGYAAVFNTAVDIGGMFTEQVRQGAFLKTISEADVRALWNHNADFVLARNKSGTLKLMEDDYGLKVEIDPVDNQWSRDLQASMRRGDVNQMSFAFKAVKEDWDNEQNIRSLLEVRLYDVSVVTYPAYPQATAQIRSQLTDIDAITGILFKASRGVKLKDTDLETLRKHHEIIRSYLPMSDSSEPGNAHSEANEPNNEELIHSVRALIQQAHERETDFLINSMK